MIFKPLATQDEPMDMDTVIRLSQMKQAHSDPKREQLPDYKESEILLGHILSHNEK